MDVQREERGAALVQVPDRNSYESSDFQYDATESNISMEVEKLFENKSVRLKTDEGRGEVQRVSIMRLHQVDDREIHK